jgi:hypothetical protein
MNSNKRKERPSDNEKGRGTKRTKVCNFIKFLHWLQFFVVSAGRVSSELRTRPLIYGGAFLYNMDASSKASIYSISLLSLWFWCTVTTVAISSINFLQILVHIFSNDFQFAFDDSDLFLTSI